MGAVANPSLISQFCLLGVDYTVVIITTNYESYSNIPTSLRLKKEDGSFSITDVCHVHRRGVAPDSLGSDPAADSGADSGQGGLAPPSGLGAAVPAGP